MATCLRRITIMIAGVSMPEAKVKATLRTLNGYQLLLLARLVRAFVGEDFRLVRFTVLVNVLADSHVGRDAAWRRYGFAAQRTRRHLYVLFVRRSAIVLLVTKVARAGTGKSVHGRDL